MQIPPALAARFRRLFSFYDRDGSGSVDVEEFVDSHARVIAAFEAEPVEARRFIEMAAGGFFDLLDLDGDGVLLPADLEASPPPTTIRWRASARTSTACWRS